MLYEVIQCTHLYFNVRLQGNLHLLVLRAYLMVQLAARRSSLISLMAPALYATKQW